LFGSRAPVAGTGTVTTAFQPKDAPRAFGPRGTKDCQVLKASARKNSIPIFGRSHKEKICRQI
jgi:hypothetical protein